MAKQKWAEIHQDKTTILVNLENVATITDLGQGCLISFIGENFSIESDESIHDLKGIVEDNWN
jgi:hypothetical protein